MSYRQAQYIYTCETRVSSQPSKCVSHGAFSEIHPVNDEVHAPYQLRAMYSPLGLDQSVLELGRDEYMVPSGALLFKSDLFKLKELRWIELKL